MKRGFLSLVVVGALVLTPSLAYAQGLVPCGPAGQTVPGQESQEGCTLKDLFTLIVNIYNYLLGMAGIVAFGFLIYGGVQMLLFSVDEEKVKSGKSTVTEALIGLAVILLAYVIVNTLLTALGITEGASTYFSGSIFGD